MKIGKSTALLPMYALVIICALTIACDPDRILRLIEYHTHMNAFIQEQMEQNNVMGLSIAVVEGDEIIYHNGFGFADKENQVWVTENTLFEVGSISKLFTGIAVMQLVEKGLVDLDAPLETYFPDFSVLSRFNDAALITPRSIMTHHSGLTGEKIKGNASPRDGAPPEDFRELVSYFANEHVAYPPGFISAYSNIGVSLLGILIENVDGRNYEDYVRKDPESCALLAISTYDEHNGISILHPISDIEAIRIGRGRDMNDTFYFDVHEGKQSLRYSGLTFEKVEGPVSSHRMLDSNEMFSRLRNKK